MVLVDFLFDKSGGIFPLKIVLIENKVIKNPDPNLSFCAYPCFKNTDSLQEFLDLTV